MKPTSAIFGLNRRAVLSLLAALPALSDTLLTASAQAQTAPTGGELLSWNEGPAKQAIVDFVRVTTDRASPTFVPPEERIATFDQDGTLWVEHPMYSQVIYCLDCVPAVVAKKPELKNVEPFKTVPSGNREAMAKFTMKDLEIIGAHMKYKLLIIGGGLGVTGAAVAGALYLAYPGQVSTPGV